MLHGNSYLTPCQSRLHGRSCITSWVQEGTQKVDSHMTASMSKCCIKWNLPEASLACLPDMPYRFYKPLYMCKACADPTTSAAPFDNKGCAMYRLKQKRQTTFATDKRITVCSLQTISPVQQIIPKNKRALLGVTDIAVAHNQKGQHCSI